MSMSNLNLNQWYHVDKTKYVYEHYIRFNGINQYQSSGHGDMLIYNSYWRWVENGPTNIRKDSVYTEVDESIINQLKAENALNTSNLKQIQPHEIKQGDFIYYTLYDTICYILSARVGGTIQNDCRIIKQHDITVDYEREYNFCSGDIYLIQGEELNRLKAEYL